MAKKRANKKSQGKKGTSNGKGDDDFDYDGANDLKKIPSGNLADVAAVAKICAAVGFFLYANSLFGEFPYDDGPAVKNNPDVLDKRGDGQMSPFSDIWRHDFWGTDIEDPTTHKSYRPLVILSYRVDAMVTSSPWIFHLTNSLLYALTSWLIVRVLADALPSDSNAPDKNKKLVLMLASLWFVTHPIHTESVAQIVGRAEILAALLCLTASRLYLSNIVGAAVCLAAACLCKETSVVMPVVLAVADLLAAYLGPSSAKNKPSIVAATGRSMFMGAVSAGYISFRAALFARSNSMGISNLLLMDNFLQHLGPMDKLRTALYIQAKYFQLLVWPFSKLSCDYSLGVMPIVTSWFSLEILLVIGVLCAVMFWAIMGLMRVRKTGDASLLLAFGWTFAPLIPASHIVDIGTVLAERLLFMPSIGIAILICQVMGMRAKEVSSLTSKWGGILLGISVWHGLKTLARVPQWSNTAVLYTSDILAYPDSLKLNYMIGKGGIRMSELVNEGKIFNCAKRAYDITQENEEHLTKGPYMIGLSDMAFAKTRVSKWPQGANLTEALEYIDQVMAPGIENVDDPSFIMNVKATAIMRKGIPTKDKELLNEAASLFQEAVEYDTDEKAFYGLFCEYGMTLAMLGRKEEAYEKFQVCFKRHRKLDEGAIEFTHLQNYGILMRELSGIITNDLEAAKSYGAPAALAIKEILNHPQLKEKDKWQRVAYQIEVMMASATAAEEASSS